MALSNSDLAISANTFNKITKSVMKIGFQEGAVVGKEQVFQKGFDAGYIEGLKTGMTLGYVKGLLHILPSTGKLAQTHNIHTSESETLHILETSSKGICQVCVTRATDGYIQDDEDVMQQVKTLPATIELQRDVTRKTLKKLSDCYFEELNNVGIVLNVGQDESGPPLISSLAAKR